MPPRRPGASKKDDLATLATLPDFVDPDEAVVSSWFADYKSEETSEGSVAWLAEVASNPQRSDRLGVGATPAKVADQPAKELQPLGKAARKAMNRRLRREKEEAEYALQGQRRLQKLGGNGASSDSEEDQGRAARPGTGAGSARRGDVLSELLAQASASQDDAAERRRQRRKRNRQKVSDDLDPPLRSGLAPPRPPPSVILSSLFDQGVRSKFHGEIKSFSEAKGYGFISCEKVWNLLRCDVHFSLSEVYDVDPQQISEKVRVGSKCTFWCNLDRSGRPQAKVVRITEVAERPPENKTLTETDQVKYEGRIKSFKEDTGYGFISCDETFKKFNRDVFLHHKQLANCKAKVGDLVRFKIFESKGQPKALGLELIEAADAPQSPQASDKAADAPHSPQTASDKAASTQDTASARLLDDEQVAKPEELEDPADLWEQGWTRYRISESSDEYWWCREKTNEYFLESEPDEWSKFLDPNTAKEYWWHQSGRCFWV